MHKRSHNQKRQVSTRVRTEKPLSKRQALEAVGEVVYAVRFLDGTIKIGWTTNVAARVRHLKCRDGGACEIIGIRLGGYEDEQAIHATLVPHRARGREFYHPTAEVLAVVNDMRKRVGLPPLAA